MILSALDSASSWYDDSIVFVQYDPNNPPRPANYFGKAPLSDSSPATASLSYSWAMLLYLILNFNKYE